MSMTRKVYLVWSNNNREMYFVTDSPCVCWKNRKSATTGYQVECVDGGMVNIYPNWQFDYVLRECEIVGEIPYIPAKEDYLPILEPLAELRNMMELESRITSMAKESE